MMIEYTVFTSFFGEILGWDITPAGQRQGSHCDNLRRQAMGEYVHCIWVS